MKSNAQNIAQALVEMSKVLSPEEYHAACDAALKLLQATGSDDLHSFPGRVLQALEAHDQIVFASITTPSGSIGEAERIKLLAMLEKTFKRAVQLEERKDPSLLGGALLRVGDEMYDASIRGQINRLTSYFLQPLSSK